MVCLFLVNVLKWSWRGEILKVKYINISRISNFCIYNIFININFFLDLVLLDGIRIIMWVLVIGFIELIFWSIYMVGVFLVVL